MKYLKTFEHFTGHDLGNRFSDVDSDEQDWLSHIKKNTTEEDEEECMPCSDEEDDYSGLKDVHKKWYDTNMDIEEGEEEEKNWGDRGVVEGKKAKPDFLDLDKDGDKKESMKKAAKDAKEKEGKKEEKGGKGLSASQKKLPAGLQKAILAKKKK